MTFRNPTECQNNPFPLLVGVSFPSVGYSVPSYNVLVPCQFEYVMKALTKRSGLGRVTWDCNP